MRDGVADVLAQRATLDRGAGVGIVLSLLLHGTLTALVIYAATNASAPQAAPFVNIEFAKMPAAAPAVQRKPAAQKKPIEPPKIEEPKPKIEPPKITEPKPAAVTPPKVEKGTVPLDPFGRSTKKGSETPPAAKPAPAPPPVAPSVGTTTAEVPIGGAGVTGLEGGDFPYTLYLQGMQRRIGTNWFRPQVAAGTAVIIYFRILRDGTISEVKVETSSGNGTFDRAALSAVRSSSKLNPLPFAYDGSYLGVHLTFR
ncbi:MAG TPA: TonB family protein [Thermoanaerobaculia bacterium]|jgi:TonB family protein|nr:TonB family protein [Thermoanaerobaculia bacterium]